MDKNKFQKKRENTTQDTKMKKHIGEGYYRETT